MRIFKQKFKDRKGKKKTLSRFYVDFTDHNGQRRRLPAFADKGVTTDFAAKLQALVNRYQSNTAIEDSPGLVEWVNNLPDDTTGKLVQWGLIPRQRGEALKPILEHLADYIAYLNRKGCCADYVKRMESRIKAVCDGCGWQSFRQITPAGLAAFLERLATLKYSATSRNHYADAIKTLLNWCVSQDGGHRLGSNPLAGVEREDRDSERKGVLTGDQFLTLIHTTVQRNTAINKASGHERGILYLLAGSTGLRRLELLLLEWGDLHLDETPPYVLGRASTTKNGKEARLPLPPNVAEVLRQFKDCRQASDGDFVFSFGGGQWVGNTADWIRQDLKAAELPLFDREGNEIFFHSLRNSFISFLANSNTPMAVVQKLARHSDPKLTYNTYARTFEDTEVAAVKTLPNIGELCLAKYHAKSSENVRTDTNKTGNTLAMTSPKTAFLTSKTIAPRGFEPLSPG